MNGWIVKRKGRNLDSCSLGGCAIIGKAHHLNQEGTFNATAQGRREGKNGEDEKARKIENEQVSPLVLDVAHISDYQVLGFTLFMRFQTELYPHSRVGCLGFAAGSVQPNLHVLNSTIEIGV